MSQDLKEQESAAQPPEDLEIERLNVSLTGMSRDLHRSWKALSALRGITMKDALLEALKEWVVNCSKRMELEVRKDANSV